MPGNTRLTQTNMERPLEQAVACPPAPVAGGFLEGARRFAKALRALHEREKSRIREEISQVPGLMALLMKPRNGKKWTRAERAELRAQMRRLSRLGLYLTTAALPGTSLTLPLLAWWLDRRQRRRLESPAGDKTP
jgi:hypothetical protein